MDRVKVAVVGCGGISRAHINGHMNCPQSNLMYCCDIDKEKAREKADTAGCQWVTNWLDIIDEAIGETESELGY